MAWSTCARSVGKRLGGVDLPSAARQRHLGTALHPVVWCDVGRQSAVGSAVTAAGGHLWRVDAPRAAAPRHAGSRRCVLASLVVAAARRDAVQFDQHGEGPGYAPEDIGPARPGRVCEDDGGSAGRTRRAQSRGGRHRSRPRVRVGPGDADARRPAGAGARVGRPLVWLRCVCGAPAGHLPARRMLVKPEIEGRLHDGSQLVGVPVRDAAHPHRVVGWLQVREIPCTSAGQAIGRPSCDCGRDCPTPPQLPRRNGPTCMPTGGSTDSTFARSSANCGTPPCCRATPWTPGRSSFESPLARRVDIKRR